MPRQQRALPGFYTAVTTSPPGKQPGQELPENAPLLFGNSRAEKSQNARMVDAETAALQTVI